MPDKPGPFADDIELRRLLEMIDAGAGKNINGFLAELVPRLRARSKAADARKLAADARWLSRVFKSDWNLVRRCDWYPEFEAEHGGGKQWAKAARFVIAKKRRLTIDSMRNKIRKAGKNDSPKRG